MIKQGNKLLQVSIDKKVVQAMDESCKALSMKLKIHVTKGMLITFLFNQWIDEISKLQETTKEEEKC